MATKRIIDLDEGVAASDDFIMVDGQTNGSRKLSLSGMTGAFAPIDSPTFTGTPSAPTQAEGDRGSALATTEFVHQALDELRASIEEIRSMVSAG